MDHSLNALERKGQEIADANWGKGKDLREQRAGQVKEQLLGGRKAKR